MLGGYQATQGLEGLGCGVDTQCGCDRRGMGSLLDPSSWGPSDFLVVAAATFAAWKFYKAQKRRNYSRAVVRRLERS